MGTRSEIWCYVNVQNGKEYAVKIMKKKLNEDMEEIFDELRLLEYVKNKIQYNKYIVDV